MGSFTPVLLNDSKNKAGLIFTVPLGNPDERTNLVSDAPLAGIVILPEELEANVLFSGTIVVPATCL